MKSAVLIALCIVGIAVAQRPGYAGRRPYGYPEMELDLIGASPALRAGGLDDRFAVDNTAAATTTQRTPSTTTQRLPLEANGDAALVQGLRMLPTDRQPFWLINYLHLEQQRNKPASYEHRSNNFLRPIVK